MKWNVLKSTGDLELVESDELWDTSTGGIRFLNYKPEPIPEPVTLCGKPCESKRSCVRALGHPGKHMESLKPKFTKPKMLPVRGFAAGTWQDFQVVKE